MWQVQGEHLDAFLRRLSMGFAFLLLGSAVALAADELHFDIQRYQVDGNSVLTAEQIEAVLASARGKGKTLSDVLGAVQRLQDAYRDAGYAAVQVFLPEQDTESGTIRLGVIEPKIVEIRIDGTDAPEKSGKPAADGTEKRDIPTEHAAFVDRVLPPLQLKLTPNIREIDDAVRLANENPARRIQVGLEAAASGNDILVRLKMDKSPPFRVFASMDNTGTVQTGRTRFSVGFQHANVAGLDHVLTAQYTTSPERFKQTSSYSLGYRIPFYAQKLTLDLVAAYSDTEAGTTSTPVGPLQFAGKGSIYAARLTRQLPTQGLWEHRAYAGIDYKAFANTCSLGVFGAAGCGTAGASVTIHPLTLGYSGQMVGEGLQLQGSFGYSKNLPGGQNGRDADFAAARAGASAYYDVLRGNAQVIAVLLGSWQGRGVLTVQDSSDALVSAEQFGLGGASSIRGYAERAQSNDSGWQINLEAYSPGIGEWFSLPAESLRAVLFHDSGATRRNQIQVGEAGTTRLASYGLGLRFAYGKNFQGQVDWGVALVDQGIVRAGQGRAHATLNYNW